jgi:acyl carrier protein
MADTFDTVRDVLIETLELSQSPAALTRDTALFGALPELDSFGVVQLVAAVEERFEITIDDDEFGAELFETVGSLSAFVDAKLAHPLTTR